MMLPSRLDCPLSLKTPNMGNTGLEGLIRLWLSITGGCKMIGPKLHLFEKCA